MVSTYMVCIVVALLSAWQSHGVGLRRRLAEAEADAVGGASSSSGQCDPPRVRGGLRRRLGEPDAPGDPSMELPRTSTANLPLNNKLKKDWAAGKLSSRQVQEYAMGAMQQGATGLDAMSAIGNSGTNLQNLQRKCHTR